MEAKRLELHESVFPAKEAKRRQIVDLKIKNLEVEVNGKLAELRECQDAIERIQTELELDRQIIDFLKTSI